MADLKISELSALAGANLVAADELAIVDDSASETKKITVSDLIANGVTLISDDTIPGAKILFAAGDIATAALADSAVATAKVADDAITSAKLADESTVDLVTTLPASGAFTGQLALDTDDNSLYAWDGSAWQSIAAPASVNTVSGSTTGEINIVATTSGSTVTISATIDDTASAAQFLAGPTGSGGTVGYRTIVGTDLPVATTSAKGGVIVNGNGLVMDGDTIEIDNTITSSATHHVVTYDANGLITGGRVITSADLPFATETTVGAVSVGDGLAVGAAGELSVDNTVTPGEYTKVTVTAQGLVSSATTLAAADIPDHSAAKLTSGTIGTSLIANDAITADKMADQSTVKFGGALGSDNVTIFPTGDFKGQMFWDETSEDLYIYSGSAFVPITVLSGNLVNAGAYDASTNTMSSVTTAGSSAGFSAGAALPAPAASNLNHYVVVDTSGTGSGAAPAVALAPPDMLLSQGVGTEYALIDVSNAIAGQTASNISFIASGNIAATDVQAALQEVDTEKLAKAGDTMTGALGIGTASSIVFEGSTADNYETTLTVTDPTADRTITFPDVTGNVVTTGDTGTVTSTMILDGTIVNADINASAEIAVSKLADGAARQLLQTDAAGTGVEWASNIDIPGTLDVTSTATFDSTVTVTGLITANGKVSFPAGTAAAPGLYSGTDIDTGIYAPAANQFGITTNGTAALTIDASQRVGIGTTSLVRKLNLRSTGEVYQKFSNNSTGSTIADGFDIGIGSGNTAYIWNYEADSTVFATSNTERLRIDSSGRLLVGTSSARATKAAASIPSFQIEGTGDSDSRMNIGRNANADNGPEIHLYKTRGTTLGSTTVVQDDDQLGSLIFLGADGSDLYARAAEISCFVDGTPGNDDMPGRLVFSTTADGASSPTERMRIDSSGNVGIGTSSPDALLEIEDSTGGTSFSIHNTGTSGRQYILQSTSSSASIGGGKFAIYDGDAPAHRFVLDSSGNVGVGTTSPDANLEVSGSEAEIRLRDTRVDDAGYWGFKSELSNGERKLFIQDDGSDRVVIDASGNVGIGNTAPGAKLQIEGTSDQLKLTYSSIASYIHEVHSNGDYSIAKDSSERVRIDSSGRLLVGTSSTSAVVRAIFQATSGGSGGGTVLISRGTATPSTDQTLGELTFSDSNHTVAAAIQAKRDGGTWTSGSSQPTRLAFSTTADGASSPTERMRITEKGALNVAADGGTFGGANATARFSSIAAASANYSNQQVAVFHNKGTSGTRYILSFGDGATYTERGFITWDGSNMALVNASDKRLKTNIFEANSAVESVKQINVRSFDFIENGNHVDYGFIAQELYESAPEAVNVGADDASGNIDKPWTVGYASLVPRLTKALQEAIAKIETLEAEVAALKAQ